MSDVSEISRLVTRLADVEGEERHATLSRLVPLVYRELKSLARSRRARWNGPARPGTTSLVHEAYTRIAATEPRYEDRSQFFAVASKAMRCILVDNARFHGRQKRGGGAVEVELQPGFLVSEARSEELLALDEALEKLEATDGELARVVELRCFGGLTLAEVAESLGVSTATVKRRWALARAWLHRELGSGPGSPPAS